MIQKEPKTGLLKARCEVSLEQWFYYAATVKQLDVADLIREALREFRAKNQKKYARN